jgi:hypothetical protein
VLDYVEVPRFFTLPFGIWHSPLVISPPPFYFFTTTLVALAAAVGVSSRQQNLHACCTGYTNSIELTKGNERTTQACARCLFHFSGERSQ